MFIYHSFGHYLEHEQTGFVKPFIDELISSNIIIFFSEFKNVSIEFIYN